MLHEAAHDLSQKILDQYKIGTLIRSEIYGPVYQAQHQGNQTKVRFHVLVSPDQRSLSLDRFKQSMYSVKGIKSPYLAKIHGFGEHDGLFYIAYEDNELKPLSDLIPKQGMLSFPERLNELSNWMNGLFSALQALHGYRVFHHALSLDALYINAQGKIVLTHHGIAPLFRRKMQIAMAIALDDPIMLARASYTSPEEIKGRLVTQSADLYSLTCILHQLLIGQDPFESDLVENVLQMHLEHPYKLNPLLEDWSTLITKGIMKESRDRFISIQAFATEFKKVMNKQKSVDDQLNIGLDTALTDESIIMVDGEEIEELSFGASEASEMAFGFSQHSQDERTFLEFGDIDEQTFFEENLDEAIEVAHKTGVYDSLDISDELDAKQQHLQKITQTSRLNTQEPLAVVTPNPINLVATLPKASASIPSAHSNYTPAKDTKKPVFVTRAYQSPHEEDIMEFQDEDVKLDPSRVLPLPVLNKALNKSTPFSNNSTPPATNQTPVPTPTQNQVDRSAVHQAPSAVHQSSSEKVPLQHSPSQYFPEQGNAEDWPGQADFGKNAPANEDQPADGYNALGVSQNKKKRQAPKLKGKSSAGQKIKGILIALVLMILGAGAVALFLSVDSSKQAESIMIDTEPSEMNLIINRKAIKEKTPHRHQYSKEIQEQKKVEFRFLWNNNYILKSKIPVLAGQSWLYLKAGDSKQFNTDGMHHVLIQYKENQALVKEGPKILGRTPLVLFGPTGSEMIITLTIPGAEKKVKVKFDKTQTKPIDIQFDLPKTQ
jgi:serine/threonine protein kinase